MHENQERNAWLVLLRSRNLRLGGNQGPGEIREKAKDIISYDNDWSAVAD